MDIFKTTLKKKKPSWVKKVIVQITKCFEMSNKNITCPVGGCIKERIRGKYVAVWVIRKEEKGENYVGVIFKKLGLKTWIQAN